MAAPVARPSNRPLRSDTHAASASLDLSPARRQQRSRRCGRVQPIHPDHPGHSRTRWYALRPSRGLVELTPISFFITASGVRNSCAASAVNWRWRWNAASNAASWLNVRASLTTSSGRSSFQPAGEVKLRLELLHRARVILIDPVQADACAGTARSSMRPISARPVPTHQS